MLNELCQFSGSFCNSLHCDELGHLCRVPYWLRPQKAEDPGWKNRLEVIRKEESVPERDDYLCGAGGCGLCALYRLQKAGITHLKLVGSWQPQRGYESRYSEPSQIPDNTENSGERSGILQTDETTDFPRGMQQTVLL